MMASKKTILTICPSWPGQFKSFINACTSEYNIVAICQVAKPEYITCPDNIIILHDLAFTPGAMHQNSSIFALGVLRIKDYLSSQGLKPDLAVIQVGFGLEVLAGALFPDIPTIGYFEWYENENRLDPYNMLLNTVTSDFAEKASVLITPTQFQKSQFPLAIRRKMMVLHEGVDTTFFKERIPLSSPSSGPFVITYVCRGLESIRCFLEFVRIIKLVLEEKEEVVVKIVGDDKAFYETTDRSYKAEAIEILGEELSRRVEFKGVLSKEGVRDTLYESDLHIYFTKPRGISWSLLEALSTGRAVVASNVEGLREVTVSPSGKKHCLTTDHNDYESTKNLIIDVVNKRESNEILQMRLNASSFVKEHFDSVAGGNSMRNIIKALI